MRRTFMGYRRANGTVGVRNLVLVLSAMDNINPVLRTIGQVVPAAVPLPTISGRGQFGQDHEQTQRTMIGLASNPNVAAVVVVSLEKTSAGKLADAIALSGKPVRVVTVQECGGSLNTVCAGARAAEELLFETSEQLREECDVSELLFTVECGGSDTTSGLASNPVLGMVADRIVEMGGGVLLSEISELLGTEDMLAARAVNKETADKIYKVINHVEEEAKRRGVDIRGANPVADNIRGGITTIEEKSLGGMVKGGSSPIQGVLDYACRPDGKGLYLMETPAPACESLTGKAAAGSQIAVFTTGVGNSIGHPIMPCIKISANPKTLHTFGDNIDFALDAVLSGEETFDCARDRLYEHVLKVGSGKMTKAELLNQLENANAKIQPTV